MTVPTTESPLAPRTGWAGLRSRLTPRAVIPLVLLLLALSTVFLFANDRGLFDWSRNSNHNTLTADYMTIVKNLSPKHGFLGFYYRTLDDQGDLAYRPYNRFPIGGYLLVKLAILPFWDDSSSEIHAARILMRAFFVLSAVSAYLSLCRLVSSRWVAMTATLTAFSSYYMLYYNDMVATDNMPSLFGVLLTFHGMMVFVQEGRFRQLLVKACAALLLGWHVYALLLAFIVLGLARALIRALPLFRRFGRSNQAAGGAAPSPGRYLALGVVTLLFGTALLSFNLGNEYFALGGKGPLAELPSLRSMFHRFGMVDLHLLKDVAELPWPRYLEGQFRRIGGITIPYGWIDPIWALVVDHRGEVEFLPGMFTLGAVASGVCLLGLPFVRHRMLLAVLALSGFCWMLPMRHHAVLHDFEAVFWVGIPLTMFSLIFLCIRRLIGDRFVPVLAAVALPAFVLSSARMAMVEIRPDEGAVRARLVMRDLEVIHDLLGEGVVYIPPFQGYMEFRAPIGYFLSGSIIHPPHSVRQRERVDFVILRHRDEGPALLTPDNLQMFLYDRALYDASYDEQALGRPIVASDYNVYWKNGRLIYVSEECAYWGTRFFLSLSSREASDPSEWEERRGLDDQRFHWSEIVRRFEGRCVGVIDLGGHDPDYVRTGQLGGGDVPLWEGEYRFER